MINVIHKDCGKLAFYFKVKVYSWETVRSSNVVNIDGTLPKPGDRIICGSCGALLNQVGPYNVEQKEQHWTDWFIIEKDKNMECRIDYNLLNRNGILSLIKNECVDCNLKVRMMKDIRCPYCPFVSCSGERKTRKNYFTTGIACGAKFRKYGIDPDGRLGKAYLFFFLYHPELNFSLSSLPDYDKEINKNSQWILHHDDGNNWNDHVWNLILCLRTEHSFFEKVNESLNQCSYNLLK